MTLVELYSKEGCHLCEEAMNILERVRAEIPFALHEVKLGLGEQYFDEYRDMVPVVHINKVFAFKFRVNENLLRVKLRQASADQRVPSEGDAGG